MAATEITSGFEIVAAGADMAKTLCIFLARLSDGGAERIAVTLLAPLRERGYEPFLVVGRAGGALADGVPAGFRQIHLGCSRLINMIGPLAHVLRAERPDFILSSLSYTNIAAGLAWRLSGRKGKLVLVQHSVLSRQISDRTRPTDALLGYAYRLLCPAASGLVAVSQGVADDLAATAHIGRENITVIYNPVHAPSAPNSEPREHLHPFFRRRGVPVFLAAGRLAPVKDFPSLLLAFSKLLRRVDSRLLIAGEGPDRLHLEQQIGVLGLTRHVELLGYTQNLASYLKAAATFVLSSRHEAFGNVLVEALAAGTTVVSTDCPFGPREILDGGRYGILVTPDDPEALAEGMMRALTAPFPPERLKARANAFCVASAADRYAELFHRVGRS